MATSTISTATSTISTATISTASTYLGAKGYTVYKECLDGKEQRTIRSDLNVRPYIPKSPIQPPSYPVFRESPLKYYLPRYYGLKHYGKAEENRLPPGENINIAFAGDLRDYQLNIVDVYKKSAASVGGGLLEIPCGRGKTVIALKIISELKKKTLVIVHKGFLLNQWIERIGQFLPTARVGRIQGQIIDIEGKDIVIGMLQSLSMKEYSDDMFDSFGLTIVDECHHISSEVFCRSLQRIMTAYTLGLSATMNRKDGLTKVFKMFLGDIVYSEERESTDEVLVKAIQYVVDDPEFNEMCYDYRGNPAYSTMISKLCAFNGRSEFILQVIEKELKIAPEQQVMILAHNKNLLTYLHDAIAHRKIAEGSVGYYVGGMKEADLKKSETCKIIVATYAMAAEALDIKTLTTLVLATPKTDIIQAVGRILRVKHERPMVVDIIDSHEVFLSQWQKRRKYYNENNYQIMHTKSPSYALDKWSDAHTCKAGKAGAGASKSTSKADTCKAVKAGTVTKKDFPLNKSQLSSLSGAGTSLLSKGASAAAMFINTSCDAAQKEMELDEDKYKNEDDDEDDYTKEYYVSPSGNQMLKGRCFI
jgi:superfamily II DNA or RNA helicase